MNLNKNNESNSYKIWFLWTKSKSFNYKKTIYFWDQIYEITSWTLYHRFNLYTSWTPHHWFSLYLLFTGSSWREELNSIPPVQPVPPVRGFKLKRRFELRTTGSTCTSCSPCQAEEKSWTQYHRFNLYLLYAGSSWREELNSIPQVQPVPPVHRVKLKRRVELHTTGSACTSCSPGQA